MKNRLEAVDRFWSTTRELPKESGVVTRAKSGAVALPLKKPVVNARAVVDPPVALITGTPVLKVMFPAVLVLRKNLIVLLPEFRTATSGFPSELKSATTTAVGLFRSPGVMLNGAPPDAGPGTIVMLLPVPLTATIDAPVPSRLPDVMASVPGAAGLEIGATKTPVPSVGATPLGTRLTPPTEVLLATAASRIVAALCPATKL